MARVIKVNNVQLIASDQDVARVKVAVQSNLSDIACPGETGFNAVEHQLRDALIGLAVVVRNKIMVQQVLE